MDLLQDVRVGARSLLRQPGVTVVAVLCLGLGIGANTAIFSVVRGVLLAPLPYAAPERIVRVNETSHPQGQALFTGSVSTPNLADWRAQNHTFEKLAAYNNVGMNLGGDEPERVRVVSATSEIFAVLGVAPALGRGFSEGDDDPGAANVVVISDGLWRRRFGARRAVLDSTISLDGKSFTVIGIMPAAFDFPISAVRQDAWVPLAIDVGSPGSRGNHWLEVVGRLKDGVTIEAANADIDGIARRIARENPDESDRGALVRPASDVLLGATRGPLFVLLGAVALVLAISCANVANLLLARAAGRSRDIAVRVALGATGRRIARQMLTESLLLSLAGGALGILVAFGSLRAILVLATTTLPRADAIRLDAVVLAFTLGISVVTGILFGLAPALRATRNDVRSGLMEGGTKSSAGAGQHRALRVLVVAEMALSLVLVVGAGLLIRSFALLTARDPGVQPAGVLTFRTRVASVADGDDSTRYARFYGPVLERLRALPGVRAAGVINRLPIQSWGMNGDIGIVGRPVDPDPSRRPFAEFRVVSAGYFEALGIAPKKGRTFDERDQPGGLPVVLINEEFAKRYFPGEDPIGQQLSAWDPQPVTIVGVVANVRNAGLDQDPRTEVYVNAVQNPRRLDTMTFVVSSSGTAEAQVGPVREVLRTVAPDQPIYAISTMEQVIGDSLKGRKLSLVLLGVLAGLAVVLAAAGIYGVLAYTVTQRTRELGIRMALGATGGSITKMVLADAGRLAAYGVGIGLAGALALVSLLKSMIFGVTPRDPLTLLAAVAIIPVIAIVASLVPALRASRADPLIAMRAE